MTKTTTRYQVREFIGNEYSKQLGRRLRTREQAGRIVKMLKKQGRAVFASPLKITAAA
jgi:H2-forming N5,N10-methylenetetrahydromethanopterin dehydrogenase-like enzyme